MQSNLYKEIRIEKLRLAIDLMMLEDRIVNAIMDGGSPALIEEGKKTWIAGREFLRKRGWKYYGGR